MENTHDRYWPFNVLSPERQTEQHRREIRLLETAYQLGYKPYMFDSQNFGATAGERAGEILFRGRRGKHWEVHLMNSKEPALSAHVDDFNSAAEALLQWLRGIERSDIIDHLRGHLLSTASMPTGFMLHERER
jgi:hypothetical protein